MNQAAVIVEDWGLLEYADALQKQEALFHAAVRAKGTAAEQSSILNYLVFCEHPHVYTLGKSGSEENLLLPHLQLQAQNASFYRTNRGGDITYHGPGQLVVYPIIDLEQFDLGLKQYIHQLEACIIEVLANYKIMGQRLAGATGVWLDVDQAAHTRKICAIGVKCSRHITMHGLAFNLNTDLTYFNHINPCGFTDKDVTSLSKELGVPVDMNRIKQQFKFAFDQIFK